MWHKRKKINKKKKDHLLLFGFEVFSTGNEARSLSTFLRDFVFRKPLKIKVKKQ